MKRIAFIFVVVCDHRIMQLIPVHFMLIVRNEAKWNFTVRGLHFVEVAKKKIAALTVCKQSVK